MYRERRLPAQAQSAAQPEQRHSFFRMHRDKLNLAALSIAVLAADRLSKAAVIAAVPFGTEKPVLGGAMSIVHIPNYGFTFDLLPNMLHLEKISIAVGALGIATAAYALFFKAKNSLTNLGFSLIMAGGLGNFFERLRLGHVTDFISFNLPLLNRIPYFNIADVAIDAGAAIFTIGFIKEVVRLLRPSRND